MNTKTITIHGEKFDVAAPYAEGHPITAAEARVLNQTRAENVANNFRKSVKEALDKPEADRGPALEKVRADFGDYDGKYNFAVGGTARVSVDPIEREAINLAKAAIAAKLREKGIKVKDYLAVEGNQEKYDGAVEKLATSDNVIKAAKKRVAERSKVSEADLEELGLG